jgi:hypothetical protein
VFIIEIVKYFLFFSWLNGLDMTVADKQISSLLLKNFFVVFELLFKSSVLLNSTKALILSLAKPAKSAGSSCFCLFL